MYGACVSIPRTGVLKCSETYVFSDTGKGHLPRLLSQWQS